MALLAAALLCFWPLRLPGSISALVALCRYWIGLYVYAAASLMWSSLQRTSRWWLVAILPAVLVSLSLIDAGVTPAAGFRVFDIPSGSMEPTVRRGDHIVADMNCYRSRNPDREEMVIFRNHELFVIKRVIAVSGDFISAKDGHIYLNGRPLEEPYTQHIGQPRFWMNEFGPISIPKGKFFVMGNNRDVSLDSRSPEVGLIDFSSALANRFMS